MYSGLIPYETFLDPDFSVRNIERELELVDYTQVHTLTDINSWIASMRKIYKFSKYPLPEIFDKFNTIEGLNEILKLYESEPTISVEEGFPRAAQLFEGNLTGKEVKYGHIYQSLEHLMINFPGTYIYMICRETLPMERLSASQPPELDAYHVSQQKEIDNFRVPYMTKRQMNRYKQTSFWDRHQFSQTRGFNENLSKGILSRDKVDTKKKSVLKELQQTTTIKDGGKTRRRKKQRRKKQWSFIRRRG
jgi:hypothetical protein